MGLHRVAQQARFWTLVDFIRLALPRFCRKQAAKAGCALLVPGVHFTPQTRGLTQVTAKVAKLV